MALGRQQGGFLCKVSSVANGILAKWSQQWSAPAKQESIRLKEPVQLGQVRREGVVQLCGVVLSELWCLCN